MAGDKSVQLTDAATAGETLFQAASRCFDGWTDDDTGASVLRVIPKGLDYKPGLLHTLYHQNPCYLRGGRQVMIRSGKHYRGWGGPRSYRLDLTTGQVDTPLPDDLEFIEINQPTNRLLASRKSSAQREVVLYDLDAGAELASMTIEGGNMAGVGMISDGSGMIVGISKGKPYDEPIHSRIFVVRPGADPVLIHETHEWHCNHFQSNPADPSIFSYDRWPTPKRYVEQVIHVMSIDGTFHERLKMDDQTVLPGSIFGCQRDHYLWTPDGKRIASYFSPVNKEIDPASFNHFDFGWWISATDWKTGEDLAALYPPGRWGCHFGITPDSREAICAGGPGYDQLFAVNFDHLRDGWNERLICRYPPTTSEGHNAEPFPHPHVLPDGSGVLFNAGWPGDEHHIYLAELTQGA